MSVTYSFKKWATKLSTIEVTLSNTSKIVPYQATAKLDKAQTVGIVSGM